MFPENKCLIYTKRHHRDTLPKLWCLCFKMLTRPVNSLIYVLFTNSKHFFSFNFIASAWGHHYIMAYFTPVFQKHSHIFSHQILTKVCLPFLCVSQLRNLIKKRRFEFLFGKGPRWLKYYAPYLLQSINNTVTNYWKSTNKSNRNTFFSDCLYTSACDNRLLTTLVMYTYMGVCFWQIHKYFPIIEWIKYEEDPFYLNLE